MIRQLYCDDMAQAFDTFPPATCYFYLRRDAYMASAAGAGSWVRGAFQLAAAEWWDA